MGFSWTVDMMRGPTEEAKPLQLAQYQAYDAFYDAWNVAAKAGAVDSNHLPTTVEFDGAWEYYKETVFKLLDHLGEQAHCAYVDTMLWSSFSDIYKDIVTCRPSGLEFTRGEVLEWLTRQGITMRYVA
jgi:hypothetical protein